MKDFNQTVSIVIPAFKAEHSIFRLGNEILKIFSNFKTEVVT